MYPDDPRSNPMNDPRQRPSQALLVLIAIGVAVAATLLGGLLLYLSDVWTAQPLG